MARDAVQATVVAAGSRSVTDAARQGTRAGRAQSRVVEVTPCCGPPPRAGRGSLPRKPCTGALRRKTAAAWRWDGARCVRPRVVTPVQRQWLPSCTANGGKYQLARRWRIRRGGCPPRRPSPGERVALGGVAGEEGEDVVERRHGNHGGGGGGGKLAAGVRRKAVAAAARATWQLERMKAVRRWRVVQAESWLMRKAGEEKVLWMAGFGRAETSPVPGLLYQPSEAAPRR